MLSKEKLIKKEETIFNLNIILIYLKSFRKNNSCEEKKNPLEDFLLSMTFIISI